MTSSNQPHQPLTPVWTTTEAARLAKCNRSTICRLVHEGHLKAERVTKGERGTLLVEATVDQLIDVVRRHAPKSGYHKAPKESPAPPAPPTAPSLQDEMRRYLAREAQQMRPLAPPAPAPTDYIKTEGGVTYRPIATTPASAPPQPDDMDDLVWFARLPRARRLLVRQLVNALADGQEPETR